MGKASRRKRVLSRPARRSSEGSVPLLAFSGWVFCHNCERGFAPRVFGFGSMAAFAAHIPPLAVGDLCPHCGQRLRSDPPPSWPDLK